MGLTVYHLLVKDLIRSGIPSSVYGVTMFHAQDLNESFTG